MRFLSFLASNGKPAVGIRIGDEIVDLTEQGLPDSIDAMMEDWSANLALAKRASDRATVRRHVSEIDWLSPLRSPSKAIAVGLNYVDHAAESQFAPPTYPVLFHRYPSSWVAHGKSLECPRVSTQFDYEGELVVVIGKRGRYIRETDALSHAMGYSIFNDGSIRDYQTKSAQWMMGKNFDKSGSFGPEIVTTDELPAGAAGLRLRTRLNGETLQDANTRDMIFSVARLIAVCSEAFELVPGDIIITGTPAGVGMARKPQVFMKPGDVCEVEIEGIGVLSNTIANEF